MDLAELNVNFNPQSEKHFARLPREEQKKAAEFFKRVAAGQLSGAAPLRHVQGLIWRKRLGDIRILFTYDKRNREVVIRALFWRREDTYDDLESIKTEILAEKKPRHSGRKNESNKSDSKPQKRKKGKAK